MFENVTAARARSPRPPRRAPWRRRPRPRPSWTGAGQRHGRRRESYPDLKASTNFLDLQRQLADTENQLAFARQYYNDSVSTLNKLVATMPWMFFAGMANVQRRAFYQAPGRTDHPADGVLLSVRARLTSESSPRESRWPSPPERPTPVPDRGPAAGGGGNPGDPRRGAQAPPHADARPAAPDPLSSRTPGGGRRRGAGRLDAAVAGDQPWQRWGTYLSERAWGTVREDYSADGDAWNYFPYDAARSRAYRWNEDGLAGWCDAAQTLCFGIGVHNGADDHLRNALRPDQRPGQPRRGTPRTTGSTPTTPPPTPGPPWSTNTPGALPLRRPRHRQRPRTPPTTSTSCSTPSRTTGAPGATSTSRSPTPGRPRGHGLPHHRHQPRPRPRPADPRRAGLVPQPVVLGDPPPPPPSAWPGGVSPSTPTSAALVLRRGTGPDGAGPASAGCSATTETNTDKLFGTPRPPPTPKTPSARPSSPAATAPDTQSTPSPTPAPGQGRRRHHSDAIPRRHPHPSPPASPRRDHPPLHRHRHHPHHPQTEADDYYATVQEHHLSDDANLVQRQAQPGCCGASSSTTTTSTAGWRVIRPGRPATGALARAQRRVDPHRQRGRAAHARRLGVPLVRVLGPGLPLRDDGDDRPSVRQGPVPTDAVQPLPAPHGQVPAYEWNFSDTNPR